MTEARSACISQVGHSHAVCGISQNRYLAQEGAWARATEECAAGCLLVAGPQAGRYEQLVILLLQHGPDGSTGVILNRPCGAVVENLLGWGWQSPVASSLEEAFSDSRIYLGGFFSPARIARQPITCLHGQVRGWCHEAVIVLLRM